MNLHSIIHSDIWMMEYRENLLALTESLNFLLSFIEDLFDGHVCSSIQIGCQIHLFNK